MRGFPIVSLAIFIAASLNVWFLDAARAAESYSISERIDVDPNPGMLTEIGLGLGLASNEKAYAIALITGVDEYKLLGRYGETLRPAKKDLEQLKATFRRAGFNEIVVLWNDDFTAGNLHSVLRNYIDPRLSSHNKSRFLMAHSGHGASISNAGYLLTSRSKDFQETSDMIPLSALREVLSPTVDAAFQSLVLLNSCYGGGFTSYSPGQFVPKNPGAHAITAGGSDEKTWGTDEFGSIFFDRIVRGLDGSADTLPKDIGGDGIVTTFELHSYLRQTIQTETNHNQNPDLGKLRIDRNKGEFFFPVLSTQDDKPGGDPNYAKKISFGYGDLVSYRGQIASPVAFTQIGLQSSLIQKQVDLVVKGGTLDLSILYDTKTEQVYFRDIAFKSQDIVWDFEDKVEVGIASPKVRSVKVHLDFNIYVRLDSLSRPLRLEPGKLGRFKLENFFTSECNFSCYDLEISGRWTISVDGVAQEGRIFTHDNGSGVGADVQSAVMSQGFPEKFTFGELSWHGNHNILDGSFPPLINEMIDGVPVVVRAPTISFIGHGPSEDGSFVSVALSKLD